MKIVRLPYLLLVTMILVVGYVPARGQIKNQKIFDSIPVAQCARFVTRLGLYIGYSINNQQSQLETLYDEGTLCDLCKGKRDCIDNCKRPMTLQVPEGFTFVMVALKPVKVKPYTATRDWAYFTPSFEKLSNTLRRMDRH